VACVASAHPLALVLGAVLIGLGHGVEGPMASHLLAAHVPAARRALWFSVKQTGVQVGAVAASLLLPLLSLRWGWQWAAAVAAVLALSMAAVLAEPGRHLRVPRAAAQAGHGFAALAALRQRPPLRWLALAAACFGAVQVVLNGFFVTYAATERGASLLQAGAWLGAAQAGGLVGRVLWGWVAGRLGAVMPLLFALGSTMAVCSAWLGMAGPAWWLLVAFGLSASGWNGIFLAEVAHRVPAAEAGTATASVLVVMTVGLIAGPLVFSWVGAASSLATAFVAWAAVALAGCAALAGARAKVPASHARSGS
jgi:MFS family permease